MSVFTCPRRPRAALSVQEAPGPQEAQGKVTPLEWDMQLQCAELVFRNLLEGKRVAIHPSEDSAQRGLPMYSYVRVPSSMALFQSVRGVRV